MLATIQEKQKVSEIENNRTGAILNVPTPMGHLAKIKVLEYGTIGWQAGGQGLMFLQRCEFCFNMLLGSMSTRAMVLK